MSDQTNNAIAQATAGGWQIVSRDANGIQFRQPKAWSKGAVVTGCVLLLFWGLGLLVLALAALDYLMAKDKLAYATSAQLATGQGPGEDTEEAVTFAGVAKTFLYIVGGFVVLVVGIGLTMRLLHL